MGKEARLLVEAGLQEAGEHGTEALLILRTCMATSWPQTSTRDGTPKNHAISPGLSDQVTLPSGMPEVREGHTCDRWRDASKWTHSGWKRRCGFCTPAHVHGACALHDPH